MLIMTPDTSTDTLIFERSGDLPGRGQTNSDIRSMLPPEVVQTITRGYLVPQYGVAVNGTPAAGAGNAAYYWRDGDRGNDHIHGCAVICGTLDAAQKIAALIRAVPPDETHRRGVREKLRGQIAALVVQGARDWAREAELISIAAERREAAQTRDVLDLDGACDDPVLANILADRWEDEGRSDQSETVRLCLARNDARRRNMKISMIHRLAENQKDVVQCGKIYVVGRGGFLRGEWANGPSNGPLTIAGPAVVWISEAGSPYHMATATVCEPPEQP